MILTSLHRSVIATVDPYVEKKVDPALMTWDEFWNLVNPCEKSHSSEAYNWSLAEMNEGFNDSPEDYPQLLFRKKIQGLTFEFRMNQEDRYQQKYVKSDPQGNHVYINGELQYHTPEELSRLLKNRYDYSLAVFESGQKVAVTQDEWGALLVAVAREYRQFGLATLLTKMAWELEPGKDTGGCTPAGARMVQRAHAEFVREYLRKGFYSDLVRQGRLTQERVRAILTSAKIAPSSPRQETRNLDANNPNDLLLYAEDGMFILYNRRLKDLIEEGGEENEFWIERFIKGTAFAGGGYHATDRYYLHQLGADTPQYLQFMVSLALSFCYSEGLPLHVYDEDLKYIPAQKVEQDGNLVSLKSNPVDYHAFSSQEVRFRRSFDRYGEFKNRLLELAEVKYR